MRSRLLAVGAFLVCFAFALGTLAQGNKVELKEAWARATPGGAQTAAAYLTLQSPTGDRLTGVSTPVAKEAGLHSMTLDNGVMKMRQVDGIDLPAGQVVTLEPNGYHIMLTGLGQPLKQGQTFPLTLTFAKAGSQTVAVSVQKVGSMGPGKPTGGVKNMPEMNMPMHR